MQTSLVASGTWPVLQLAAFFQSWLVPFPVQLTPQAGVAALAAEAAISDTAITIEAAPKPVGQTNLTRGLANIGFHLSNGLTYEGGLRFFHVPSRSTEVNTHTTRTEQVPVHITFTPTAEHGYHETV
jgi:hypothetical protein